MVFVGGDSCERRNAAGVNFNLRSKGLYFGADLLADFEAVDSRKHEVENDEVRWGLEDFWHRLVSAMDQFHSKALPVKKLLDQGGELLVIFDYQDALRHASRL